MKHIIYALLLATSLANAQKQKPKSSSEEVYFPGPDVEWTMKSPAAAGMNFDKLQEAIAFSVSHESKNPRDMEESHYQSFGKEPFGSGIGPFKDRGEVAGIVLRHGYIVAEWGDPFRVDMTHSVTKSFLSTVIGIAVDRGMIRSVHDTVWKYVPAIQPYTPIPVTDKATQLNHSQWITTFETNHNRKITWDRKF